MRHMLQRQRNLKSTLNEQCVTFETFEESDEETWAEQQIVKKEDFWHFWKV